MTMFRSWPELCNSREEEPEIFFRPKDLCFFQTVRGCETFSKSHHSASNILMLIKTFYFLTAVRFTDQYLVSVDNADFLRKDLLVASRRSKFHTVEHACFLVERTFSVLCLIIVPVGYQRQSLMRAARWHFFSSSRSFPGTVLTHDRPYECDT